MICWIADDGKDEHVSMRFRSSAINIYHPTFKRFGLKLGSLVDKTGLKPGLEIYFLFFFSEIFLSTFVNKV